MTLEEKMCAWQNGDEEAFTSLYEALSPSLYAFVFRYTREEPFSLDIVHDAFEQLCKAKNDYDVRKGTVKSYVFQIAYRQMVNKLNRRKRLRRFLPFLVPQREYNFSYEEKTVVQEAISKLSEKHRAVILLTYYENLTQQEIAQVLQIEVGTVKSRLHRAKQQLKRWLEEDEDDR